MKRKRNKINKVPLSDSNMSKIEMMSANYDPNGSYTGLPVFTEGVPVVPPFPDANLVGSQANLLKQDAPLGNPEEDEMMPVQDVDDL